MDYRESINRLLSLVDHERRQPVAPRQKQIFDLGRMDGFLELLGNPHRSTPTIHVAGTKGKGSTAAFCDAVLAAAGYRTGFYSSPHLHSFCERIRLDAAPISQPRFASLVQELWPYQERIGRDTQLGEVSLFEFMTAMAFWCFSEDRVDFQTIEVGLGGRLDATNVVEPEVAIITMFRRGMSTSSMIWPRRMRFVVHCRTKRSRSFGLTALIATRTLVPGTVYQSGAGPSFRISPTSKSSMMLPFS